MVPNNKEALGIITNLTTEIFPDCRILLFGSRARLDYSESSDYDFLIITKEAIDVQKKETSKQY